MANSIAKLLDSFFDNKMEDFETAFPAAIESVNDDGTVNVRPSVRNCLRNMQMEPNMKDGKLMVIKNVPVLWAGTKTVHIEYELDKGDTVLCISSSRDIRNWKKEKWNEAAYDPVSFSGNDLLNLLAIPFRRIQESATTVINIDREGNVTIKASEVKLDAENVLITGKLDVDGDISSGGNIASDGEIEASGKVKGSDFATPTLTFSKHMHPTAAQGAPSGPQPLAP
ncbi:Gp138 family membrane-puncturing spike protein [Fibrobacter sp. UWB5]|uniref:Gp138 family membrane-puncturing spike protein n=1 Tax=Fibrobacter sp. UWB5 TaxID=1964360 RepID=UPI000B5231EE|nr:hypothetical protein B7989_05050 [Fibrobacter sp. UWB5]